jgi:hypothetical protein
VRFINWYIGKLHVAARHDAVLANAFLQVANLVMSPAGLLHPSVIARVDARDSPGMTNYAVRLVIWLTQRKARLLIRWRLC